MTNFQLFSGQSIRDSKNATLSPITLDQVFTKITRPDSDLTDLVNKLRVMYTIDKRKYADMKLRLPYIIPANFKGNIRNVANFTTIRGFFIDLDDLPAHGLDPDVLTATLKSDERVALLFKSPGGYGLKLLFMFREPLNNSKQFTDFYKSFALRFSRQYQLEKVMDFKTSDVTRICFLSVDYNAHLNVNAKTIDIRDYISTDLDLYEETSEIMDKSVEQINKINPVEASTIHEPSVPVQVMKDISRLLSPNPQAIKLPKAYYVPPQLDRIEELLRPALQQQGISIETSKPIQYGKQIRFKTTDAFAEINIFYGKSGFSLVSTTRKGYNPHFSNQVLKLLSSYLIYSAALST